MAHDPSLGFADYFSAADASSSAEVATLMAPGTMAEAPELFGLHAADMESFLGMRGQLAAMPGAAHAHGSKAAVIIDADQDGSGSATLRFVGEQHHQQAPLSLSLFGPDGVGVTLHQQQQLGDSSRHHHNQQHAAAWMQQQQHDYDSPAQHGQQQQLQQGGAWQLRGSRFLLPAQQLLREFCSLPVDATSKQSKAKPPQEEDGGEVSSAAASLAPSTQIQGMDALELQRLKDKLYIMLEEVDRRYRRYCEQIRSVAGGFEAAAGDRAAAAYTELASRTISRHFRSLRDGVVAQLQAVRRALGEKQDAAAAVPGMTRGDTPRLRVLDQCIRQHKALALQGGVMEAHPWRPQRGLPERAVTILRAWLFEHFLHPYPSDVDKHILARQTGLSRSQVSNWFINARVRLWKPMVEEMYVEEMKCDQQTDGGSGGGQHGMNNANNPSCSHASEAHGGGHVVDDNDGDHGDNGGGGGDRKPTRAQLLHHDAGSLAAVVNVGRGAGGARLENFGVTDHLDFDAYDGGGHHQAGFGGVSLTLGLQQHDSHDGGGVNIAFGAPPPSAHHHGGPPPYLFAAGGHQPQMEGGGGGHHVQFGVAAMDDVEETTHGQEHYRNLNSAGFHLLRDLAG